MKRLTTILVIFVLLVLLEVIRPTDATDKSWYNRSGMTLHIDNETGLHYLSKGIFGGVLIPRLDKNGKQIGEHNRE